MNGKKGPMFEEAMARNEKFGNKNVYILTARPANSANAIHTFLKGLGLIIQDYTGKKQTNIATKELLIRLYETEINSGKKDILLKLMEAEGKNVLASQIKNGKTIQHEIMSEGYNISFLDIILLFLHLKIPLIIYSKNLCWVYLLVKIELITIFNF